jgi:hypothetical protein
VSDPVRGGDSEPQEHDGDGPTGMAGELGAANSELRGNVDAGESDSGAAELAG